MHAIDYNSFPENTSKETMLNWARDYAARNSDRQENPSGDYYNSFTLYSPIFETEEEAEKYLDNKGAYVDGAVRYKRKPSRDEIGGTKTVQKAGPSAKMQRIELSIKKAVELLRRFAAEHSVQRLSSEFIGCPNCKSKISKAEMKKKGSGIPEIVANAESFHFSLGAQNCPVCGSDLRSDYIPKKINEYKTKISSLLKLYKEAKNGNVRKEKITKNTTEIWWLAKVEVHC